jgi:hypothetical protein
VSRRTTVSKKKHTHTRSRQNEKKKRKKNGNGKIERTGGTMEIEFQRKNTKHTHTQVDDGWYCVDYYYYYLLNNCEIEMLLFVVF